MTRCPDILSMTEYIKNVLYFATVRNGKSLKNTVDTQYFCIDNDLVYENYYSDFGPLNLGCLYKYCKILQEKLKQLNKQTLVHYTSIDPKKKANAAFVLGCYGVLYLNLSPKDALRPLLIHGQSYRPFQDATQGDSDFTISLLDCLQAIKKAHDLGFFDFQDFNYEEYERLNKIHGGDLNWIIPGKFLAFIGPVDYSVSLYHPPEMYIDYFQNNDVKVVIRLNKKLYDGNVFNNVGINHYDLFFHDGTCPPRNILFKFLQISENSPGAIAVHCKAGLGRTGSLIGCYLIKHYRMLSHEAIGWMRICRPGSVIGHQQDWLEKLEPWLIKQGNLYRKKYYQNMDQLPTHEYGVYSIAEKALKQRPVVFHKSPSVSPPPQRQTRSEISPPPKAQASITREVASKTSEKRSTERDRRLKSSKTNASQYSYKGDDRDTNSITRRGSGSGEPRLSPVRRNSAQRDTSKFNDSTARSIMAPLSPLPSFRTSQGSVIRTINDARSILMRSTISRDDRRRQLNNSITVTPQQQHFSRNAQYSNAKPMSNISQMIPSLYSPASRCSTQPQNRRRLGRSPSPPQHRVLEQTRATNTPQSSSFKVLAKDASKTVLREALSRLKLVSGRDGSIGAASVGAASLGARREAPAPKRAPSVHSDERPLATQGDLLNSIKLQRRLRDTLHGEKCISLVQEKASPKDRPSIKNVNSRTSAGSRFSHQHDFSGSKERQPPTSKGFFCTQRPTSPKGKRNIILLTSDKNY